MTESLETLRPENLSIRTLYKFRAWDTTVDPHGQDILQQNIIYFSSVRDFNDPAEGRIPLRYDLVPDEYTLEIMLQHVGEEFPNLTEEEQISLCHTYVAQEVSKDPVELKRRMEIQEKYAADNYGVASLSEELENVVLWSHYSDMHQGYCVGLDVRSLLVHRHALAINAKIVIDLYKVRYRRTMPALIPSELSTEDLSILPLAIKSNDWMYEKEFRLISLDGRGEMEIPDSYISRVIMGCRMNRTSREEIIELLSSKAHKIQLFESVRSDNSFNLEFRRVMY